MSFDTPGDQYEWFCPHPVLSGCPTKAMRLVWFWVCNVPDYLNSLSLGSFDMIDADATKSTRNPIGCRNYMASELVSQIQIIQTQRQLEFLEEILSDLPSASSSGTYHLEMRRCQQSNIANIRLALTKLQTARSIVGRSM